MHVEREGESLRHVERARRVPAQALLRLRPLRGAASPTTTHSSGSEITAASPPQWIRACWRLAIHYSG